MRAYIAYYCYNSLNINYLRQAEISKRDHATIIGRVRNVRNWISNYSEIKREYAKFEIECNKHIKKEYLMGISFEIEEFERIKLFLETQNINFKIL